MIFELVGAAILLFLLGISSLMYRDSDPDESSLTDSEKDDKEPQIQIEEMQEAPVPALGLPRRLDLHIGDESESDEETTPRMSTSTATATTATQCDLLVSPPIPAQEVEGPTRPLSELRRLAESADRPSALAGMTTAELSALIDARALKPYQLESELGNAERAVTVRRAWLASKLPESQGAAVSDFPSTGFPYHLIQGACAENVLGYIPLPVGYAGPLNINGRSVYLPLATTEGCLIASTHRGCQALAQGTGVTSAVYKDGMTRGAVLRFPDLTQALEFVSWTEEEEKFRFMKQKFEETGRFARLTSVKCNPTGRFVFVRFTAKTGDAMGMNMVSKGTEAVVKMLSQQYFPRMEVVSLSGNYCVDKKAAAINWIDGRGKSVIAEAIVPRETVSSLLKTNVQSLVELATSKNLVGSALAGTLGGFNAHAANIVTALFIATGQDVAQATSSSACLTWLEEEPNGDLYISVRLPSLEVGTVGGGTFLPAQSAALRLIGAECRREAGEAAGASARKLAEVVGGAVLAGELSLLSALASGDLVKSHLRHNRSSLTLAPSRAGEGTSSASLGGFASQLAQLGERSLKGNR